MYIPKKRPLSIPTMTDRAIQTLYFNQLQKQRQALILMGLEQKDVRKKLLRSDLHRLIKRNLQNGCLMEI